MITDTERLDWLEAHPLSAQVHGGSDDGSQSKVWAISCHRKYTLREAIDVLIEDQKYDDLKKSTS